MRKGSARGRLGATLRGAVAAAACLLLGAACQETLPLVGDELPGDTIAADAAQADGAARGEPDASGDGAPDARADGLGPDAVAADGARGTDDAARAADAGAVDAGDASPDGEASSPPCPPPDAESQCEGIGGPSPSKTEHPLVLVHGLGGFEDVGPLDYFFGIPEHLREHGFEVHVPELDPFTSSEFRSDQLAAYVDRVLACTCSEQVNLIGHSQGGIDIRHLVDAMDYGDRVASATTISTPHRGTPVADVALGLSSGPQEVVLDFFGSVFGEAYQDPDSDADVADAAWSVSEAGMAEFNDAHAKDPRVTWYTWAGASGTFTRMSPECTEGAALDPPDSGDVVAPELTGVWTFLGGYLVPNDGLVTVESAKWGNFRGCIPADHLDQVGQVAGVTDFDHEAFFLDHAEFLAEQGF